MNAAGFQFVGDAAGADGSAADLSSFVGVVTTWLQTLWTVSLPDLRATSAVENAGSTIRSAWAPSESSWAVRLTQSDGGTIDIALRTHGQVVAMGLQTREAPQALGGSAGLALSQGLLSCVVGQLELRVDGRRCGRPWRMERPEDLEELRAFLEDPERTLPVHVLTRPDPARLEVDVAPYLLDEDALTQRCLGLAHVVTMPPAASYRWSDMVGKVWSAYLGAVRTYRPGLQFEVDSPMRHPLVMAERVLATHYRGEIAESAFLASLVDRSYEHALTRSVHWGDLLFVDDAALVHAAAARSSAVDDRAEVQARADETAALLGKMGQLERDVEQALDLARKEQDERLRLEEESRSLRLQLERLRQAYARETNRSPDALINLPTDYEAFPEWVEQHLAGRLVLAPRALRGLRKATYEDPELAARALMVLADSYRDMQLGRPDAQVRFERGTRELGVHCSRAITDNRAGEQGDAYFVRYPTGGDPAFRLEWHLWKGKGGKDAPHQLRIYFFWHEASEQIVVGWMPGHLINRMT